MYSRRLGRQAVKSIGVVLFSVVVLVLLVYKNYRQTPLFPDVELQSPANTVPPSRCRAMFTVEKDRPAVRWGRDSGYEELSGELKDLLASVEVGDMSALSTPSILASPATRLDLMHGALPYLPCKVRRFSTGELGECTSARAARGASTWITLVGDSNQRQKIHSFIAFLPKHLNYTYYLGRKEVSLAEFTEGVALHERRPPTFDIIGRRPFDSTTPPLSPHPDTPPYLSRSTIPPNTPHTDTPTRPSNAGNELHSTVHTGQYHHTFVPGQKMADSEYYLYVLHEKNSSVRKGAENSPATYPATIMQPDPFPHTSQSFPTLNQQIIQKSVSARYRRSKLSHYDSHHLDEDEDDSLKSLLEDSLPHQTYELRVTLVWAPSGSELEHPTPRSGKKVTKWQDLASAAVVPDVIVIGFGKWMLLMREHDEELVPFTELDYLSRPLIHPLTTLASRTTVLFWAQSRYRWATTEGRGERSRDPRDWWKHLLYLDQFNSSVSLLDSWLWSIVRGTGAWYWDSTLPLNLANLRECQRLSQAGLQHYTLYNDLWWGCQDPHHSSYETNHAEIQMLFNFLCNRDLKVDKEYCCSGD